MAEISSRSASIAARHSGQSLMCVSTARRSPSWSSSSRYKEICSRIWLSTSALSLQNQERIVFLIQYSAKFGPRAVQSGHDRTGGGAQEGSALPAAVTFQKKEEPDVAQNSKQPHFGITLNAILIHPFNRTEAGFLD